METPESFIETLRALVDHNIETITDFAVLFKLYQEYGNANDITRTKKVKERLVEQLNSILDLESLDSIRKTCKIFPYDWGFKLINAREQEILEMLLPITYDYKVLHNYHGLAEGNDALLASIKLQVEIVLSAASDLKTLIEYEKVTSCLKHDLIKLIRERITEVIKTFRDIKTLKPFQTLSNDDYVDSNEVIEKRLFQLQKPEIIKTDNIVTLYNYTDGFKKWSDLTEFVDLKIFNICSEKFEDFNTLPQLLNCWKILVRSSFFWQNCYGWRPPIAKKIDAEKMNRLIKKLESKIIKMWNKIEDAGIIAKYEKNLKPRSTLYEDVDQLYWKLDERIEKLLNAVNFENPPAWFVRDLEKARQESGLPRFYVEMIKTKARKLLQQTDKKSKK